MSIILQNQPPGLPPKPAWARRFEEAFTFKNAAKWFGWLALAAVLIWGFLYLAGFASEELRIASGVVFRVALALVVFAVVLSFIAGKTAEYSDEQETIGTFLAEAGLFMFGALLYLAMTGFFVGVLLLLGCWVFFGAAEWPAWVTGIYYVSLWMIGIGAFAWFVRFYTK